jgi:hypothetical protein
MAAEPTNGAEWEERERRLLDLGEPTLLTLLYVYAVLSWIWGLVLGIVTLAQCKLEANKRVGKICLILAVVNFVLIGCLVAAYILFIFLALGAYALLASPSGSG